MTRPGEIGIPPGSDERDVETTKMLKNLLARRALRRMVARSFANGAADADWGAGWDPLLSVLRQVKYDGVDQLEDAGQDTA